MDNAIKQLIEPGGAVLVDINWFAVASLGALILIWIGRHGLIGHAEYEEVSAIKSPAGRIVWEKPKSEG